MVPVWGHTLGLWRPEAHAWVSHSYKTAKYKNVPSQNHLSVSALWVYATFSVSLWHLTSLSNPYFTRYDLISAPRLFLQPWALQKVLQNGNKMWWIWINFCLWIWCGLRGSVSYRSETEIIWLIYYLVPLTWPGLGLQNTIFKQL